MEEEEEEPPEIVTSFNGLPKDIIFDIFSRISIRNLYQLRCVCKKWLYYLHQNQEFRDFYHQKHKISPILLFSQQQTPENPSSTQFTSCYIDGTQISQIPTNFAQPIVSTLSCNGIFCFITKTNAILYDPITKRLSKLPNTNHFSSTFSWAFGYCPSLDVFKVVHFYKIEVSDKFHYCRMQEIMCEVVSIPSNDLGTDYSLLEGWNFLGKCPYDILGRKTFAHVYERLYWLISEKRYNPNDVRIMSLDLVSDSFGIVCFPKTYSNRSVECLELVEIKGKLCLTDRLPWDASMDVWMMVKEDDGFANMWVKKYVIDLMGIDHHDVRILGHLMKDYGSDCESNEGEILMKFGEKSFGFYELGSGVYRDMANVMNVEEWSLQMLLNRKFLL